MDIVYAKPWNLQGVRPGYCVNSDICDNLDPGLLGLSRDVFSPDADRVFREDKGTIEIVAAADMLTLLHIFNVAFSWGLVILIWLVQIIIYPGLARIPADDFVKYHAWYVARITVVVLPLMICEVIIAIACFFLQHSESPS